MENQVIFAYRYYIYLSVDDKEVYSFRIYSATADEHETFVSRLKDNDKVISIAREYICEYHLDEMAKLNHKIYQKEIKNDDKSKN